MVRASCGPRESLHDWQRAVRLAYDIRHTPPFGQELFLGIEVVATESLIFVFVQLVTKDG